MITDYTGSDFTTEDCDQIHVELRPEQGGRIELYLNDAADTVAVLFTPDEALKVAVALLRDVCLAKFGSG